MSLKRQRSASPSKNSVDSEHETWTSSKIEDRSSIFQAFFSPTMPAKELQKLNETKSASHRILAWRSPSTQRTLVANVRKLETGTDDDGERYGGRHVLKVLEEMRVEGALVVARWYGGVMLGPVRFGHIEDCARDAIRAWRQNEDSEGMKRRRAEDEAMERVGLVVELRDRDQNIKVLRELLDSKTRTTGEQKKTPSSSSASVVREVDYSTFPLERLRLLDKARDNTVAFLLKKIDEVEKGEVKPKQDNQSKAESSDKNTGERSVDGGNTLEDTRPENDTSHPSQENQPDAARDTDSSTTEPSRGDATEHKLLEANQDTELPT